MKFKVGDIVIPRKGSKLSFPNVRYVIAEVISNTDRTHRDYISEIRNLNINKLLEV